MYNELQDAEIVRNMLTSAFYASQMWLTAHQHARRSP